MNKSALSFISKSQSRQVTPRRAELRPDGTTCLDPRLRGDDTLLRQSYSVLIIIAIAVTFTMSSTEQPRDKSLTGLASP
jgi:hypothetical protein